MVEELIQGSVLAAALILLSGLLKQRWAVVAPGLLAFAVIMAGQYFLASSDALELQFLGWVETLSDHPDATYVTETLPEDPVKRARLVKLCGQVLSLALAVFGYVPLIMTVLLMHLSRAHFLAYFVTYFAAVLVTGFVWIQGLGADMRLFAITWRHGSTPYYIHSGVIVALLFALPVALAQESAEAIEESGSFFEGWSLAALANRST